MNNRTAKLLGLFLILIGVGYLGDQLYFWDFSIFFDGWWAVLIVLIGLCSMMDDGFNLWNVLACTFGLYFFLSINDIIYFTVTIPMVLSILLIILGIKLLLNKEHGYYKDTNTSQEESDIIGKRIYIHSAFNTRKVEEEGIIDHCRIENIFGTVYLDLSKCDLRTLDLLSIESIFGTVNILVPDDVNLKLYKNRILSGSYIDNSYSENGYNVTVKGTSVFGVIRIHKLKDKN